MANRKERRAHAQAQAKPNSPHSNIDVPLSQPSRMPPPHKTLLEIAAERQLSKGGDQPKPIDPQSVIMTTINPNGTLSNSPNTSPSDDLDTAPYLDIPLYTLSLIFLHFTLTLLVHHQYALEPPSLSPLFLSSTVFSLTPVLLLLLVSILHPRSSHPVTQVIFAAMSILAGGWLVHATNDEPYMAVMKRAPALGTLWVWGIVEMRWDWAVACLSVVGGWGWWKGYTLF